MKINLLLIICLALLVPSITIAQDLMDMLGDDQAQKTEYTYATFKASRIVNGQSIENPKKGALNFVISHHFGQINEGWYEFFGLDQANIRFGFEYGITDWLAIGIGRTSVNKTYDGSAKVKILRQSKGLKNMPLSLSYYTDVAITSLKWQYPERNNYFSSRLYYVHELLIARKFSKRISLQLTPAYIHRNLVPSTKDPNDIFAVGAGGRFKLTNRLAINAEYFYLLNGKTGYSYPDYNETQYHNSFSFGLDIETGGHVFQIYLTNSQGLIDSQFIPNTTGDWFNGDIHIGFNINRTFQIVKPKTVPKD